MICKNCNRQLADGELICKECGYEAPLMEARERLELVKEKHRSAVLTSAKSRLFLASAICFSIATLGSVVSAARGNLFGILSAVFMIISAVGIWKCYAAKDNSSLSEALRSASLFDALSRVLYMITAAFLVVVAVAVAIALPLIFGGEEMSGLKDVIIVAGFVCAVAFIIVAALNLLYGLIFRGRRRYFLALSNFAEKGLYSYEKAPVVGSYFLGVTTVIGGFSTFVASLFYAAVIGGIVSATDLVNGMTDFPGDDTIALLTEPFLGVLASGLVFSAFSQILLGVYYILSANWMTNTHTLISATKSFVNHEQVDRLELERETKEAREKMQNAECETENTEPTSNEEPVEASVARPEEKITSEE